MRSKIALIASDSTVQTMTPLEPLKTSVGVRLIRSITEKTCLLSQTVVFEQTPIDSMIDKMFGIFDLPSGASSSNQIKSLYHWLTLSIWYVR